MTNLSTYYEESYPPSVLIYPLPTGVTRGAPGSFTPAGCNVPNSLAELQALGALGQTVAWTTGQYVSLDPVGSAYWTGTAWALGVAP